MWNFRLALMSRTPGEFGSRELLILIGPSVQEWSISVNWVRIGKKKTYMKKEKDWVARKGSPSVRIVCMAQISGTMENSRG
jgi:hypothetical protein